ncbi:hypothetical protein MMSP_1953 [Mycobacterium sp. 012931]|nr:hypothetical protein MMSP_1953 [Mycobacterium sp. 012931]
MSQTSSRPISGHSMSPDLTEYTGDCTGRQGRDEGMSQI